MNDPSASQNPTPIELVGLPDSGRIPLPNHHNHSLGDKIGIRLAVGHVMALQR